MLGSLEITQDSKILREKAQTFSNLKDFPTIIAPVFVTNLVFQLPKRDIKELLYAGKN